MTAAAFEKLALALTDVTTAQHFDRLAFRVPQRIFATLGKDGDVNFRLTPELQAAVVQSWPEAFAAIDNAWGRQGWTRCELARVDAKALERVVLEAHALAGARAKRKRR